MVRQTELPNLSDRELELAGNIAACVSPFIVDQDRNAAMSGLLTEILELIRDQQDKEQLVAAAAVAGFDLTQS